MELTSVLHISDLNFEFDTRILFSSFTLQLSTGTTWLRGANGAGKTTLLKLAGGALTPLSGAIKLDGIDSRTAALAYRLRSFYCGGDTLHLPWLTVQEYLDLHLSLYPASDPALLNVQLHAFDLLSTLTQAITTLSLGQYKKMQLSLALSLPVRLLLIDEPFNGLDASAIIFLRQQLSDLDRLKRQCILLTSHLDPAVQLVRIVHL